MQRVAPNKGGGIIPAYAGSTRLRRTGAFRGWDHPRVCGGHPSHRTLAPRPKGSSPRMRGAPVGAGLLQGPLGIIPAYAGSTLTAGGPWASAGDHPRVCGEHELFRPTALLVSGSSPRMRGALRKDWLRRVPHGIIPAYAGSTVKVNVQNSDRWDHPRVCGEHADEHATGVISWGSSPRMRGARICSGADLPSVRIIPAYAGSTKRRASHRSC